MTPPSGQPLDALLVHAGWARTLARHLVRDADAADDLVQRAWLAALERPPADAIPPRRWLAAVLRNLARETRRGDARRAERESAAAKPEPMEPSSPVEQIELQRRLLAAIESLGEPYRATVWARYYEGLSPRAIAARDGLPVKTVATRLHRALHELRVRLDRDHGGQRGAWTALFLPMIDVPLAPAALMGAFLVDAKLKIAGGLAVAAGVLCAGFVLFDVGAVDPEPSRVAAPATVVLHEPTEPIADTPVSADRMPVPEAEAKPTVVIAPQEAAASAPRIQGRVVDLEDRPVPHVRLVVEDMRNQRVTTSLDLQSDGDGRFELPASTRGTTVQTEAATWVTVFAGYVHGSSKEVIVYVAPRRELAGVVVDAQGRVVPGARVEIELDSSLRRAEGRRLDGAYAVPCAATTDAHGHFELLDAPLCASMIVATAFEHGTARVEAPAAPALDLKIVLPALEARRALVRGIVVDAQRKPVDGAWVAAGSISQRTAADGRFELDLSDRSAEVQMEKTAGVWRPMFSLGTLRAVKVGHLPVEIALPTLGELREREKPAEFELVLGEAPRAIEGHVVDVEGRPMEGASVRNLDEQRFGQILEEYGGGRVGRIPTIESLLRGGALEGQAVVTGADGSFRIEGLLDREYRLVAVDPTTLRRVTTAPVQAGSRDVRIVIPTDRELPRIAGRVVSRAGEPLAGIAVIATRAWEDGQPETIYAGRRETDEAGRFDFGRLDPEGLKLQLTSATIFIVIGWEPPQDARLDELEIAVSTRCLVQVDLGDRPDMADEFSIVDEHGEPAILLHFAGPVMWLPQREPIVEGRSEVIAVEEKGRTVVLWKNGEEVARLPVRLDGQNLTIVRP